MSKHSQHRAGRMGHRWIGAAVALWFCLQSEAQVPSRIPGAPEEAIFNLYKRVTELETQVNALKQELAAARNRAAKQGEQAESRVTTPFEVVDRNGAVLMRIVDGTRESRGLYVYNEGGAIAAHVGVHGGSGGGRIAAYDGKGNASSFAGLLWDVDGGSVQVRSLKGNRSAELRSDAGLQLFTASDQVAAHISAQKGGGSILINTHDGKVRASANEYGFTVHSDKGLAMARVGGVNTEGGLLLIGSPAGKPVVEVFGNDGGNLHIYHANGAVAGSFDPDGLSVVNEKGNTAGHLLIRPSGAGVFQLFGPEGQTMVEAGTLEGGIGTVRVGPKYRCMAMSGPTAVAGGIPDCLKGRTQ